jgi:hypothetical protein
MRTNTKKFKVLQAIGRAPNGLRFTDIQRVACELNGHDFDEFRVEDVYVRYDREAQQAVYKRRSARRWRGFWCTNLVYAGAPGGGILNRYCEKVNGRWILKIETRMEMQRAVADSLAKQHLANVKRLKAAALANVTPLLNATASNTPTWDTWS